MSRKLHSQLKKNIPKSQAKIGGRKSTMDVMAGEALSGIANYRDVRADKDHTQAYRKIDKPSTNTRTLYL
jgi:hypothetical protein